MEKGALAWAAKFEAPSTRAMALVGIAEGKTEGRRGALLTFLGLRGLTLLWRSRARVSLAFP